MILQTVIFMKWKVTRWCLTLCHPMDCTVHGILLVRILEWVAFPFSRVSSQPRDRTQVSHIAGSFFTLYQPQGSPGTLEWVNLPLLQWIFLTQESNPGLLHCKWILYQLSHKNTGRKIQLITNIHNIWHISCYEIIEQPHFFLQTCWSPSMRLLGHVPSCPLFFPQSDVLKPHWHHNIYFING